MSYLPVAGQWHGPDRFITGMIDWTGWIKPAHYCPLATDCRNTGHLLVIGSIMLCLNLLVYFNFPRIYFFNIISYFFQAEFPMKRLVAWHDMHSYQLVSITRLSLFTLAAHLPFHLANTPGIFAQCRRSLCAEKCQVWITRSHTELFWLPANLTKINLRFPFECANIFTQLSIILMHFNLQPK